MLLIKCMIHYDRFWAYGNQRTCINSYISLKFYACVCILLHHLALVSSMKAEAYDTRSFEVIRTSSYPHFVMFYAPWCGHCKRVQTVWDQFAVENHVTRRMKVAKVDCTSSTPICAAENIRSYPTFILFNDQKKYAFKGSREITEFTHFVNEKVTNLKDAQVPQKSVTSSSDNVETDSDSEFVLPTVLTKETFKAEIDVDYTFVDFYAPWCMHCLKLEPVWEKLADTLKYNKKVTIAMVDCTAEKDLCKSHNINGYPTLHLFKNGNHVTQFREGRSLSNLVSFVQSHLARDEAQNGERLDKGEAENSVKKKELSFLDETLTNINVEMKLMEDTFKSMMLRTPHLIYFHNSGPEFSNKDVLIFEQVEHKLKSMNYVTKVAIIDCSKMLLICGELGVSVYPSVMLFRSIVEYSQYFGMIDVEKIVEFVIKDKEGEKKDEL